MSTPQNQLYNVLVIGSGAREHALAWAISKSKLLGKLFVLPGNAGTSQISEDISISLFGIPISSEHFKLPPLGSSIEKWHEFFKVIELVVRIKAVDLIVVQAEDPISHGIEDWFRVRGFKVFAASNAASILEWSKIFPQGYLAEFNEAGFKLAGQVSDKSKKKKAKKTDVAFFIDHAIPHARGFGFRELPENLAAKIPDEFRVVKASGLRAGKGVSIADSAEEVVDKSEEILADTAYRSGDRGVVIQELLEGWEVSAHAFSDGTKVSLMPFVLDVKRIGEGDTGENTGGVAAICGPDIVPDELAERIQTQIIEKTVLGMKKIGRKLVGVVYPGLFVTKDGPKAIEYNIRFGDPEAQVILAKLKTDIVEIMLSCLEGSLSEIEIEWDEDFTVCVVLCSGGYPDVEKMKLGLPISGLDKVADSVLIFHAGTKINEEGQIVTNGGRVLSVVGRGKTKKEALTKAYEAAACIDFENMYFRRDLEEVFQRRK